MDEDLLENVPIHGELNVEMLVFRQIERINLSATQDEILFASNVRILMSMVPSHKREEILDRSDEYTSTSEHYEWKFWCGVPLGTVENPVNNSPYKIEEEVIDWHKLYEIVLEILEDCNLTWQLEKWTIEIGKVKQDKPLPPPTPVFVNKFEKTVSKQHPELKENEVLDKKLRPCAICGKHVNPGTGCFYKTEQMPKKKIVHKNECRQIAEQKWKVSPPE